MRFVDGDTIGENVSKESPGGTSCSKEDVNRVKEQHLVIGTLSFLQTKTLPADLAPVLGDVQMIKFVKTRPVKNYMSASLCEEMETKH